MVVPRPYVTPKVEKALAELVLSDILAMHPLDRVMTPSTKPIRARIATAHGNDVTVPRARVRTLVSAALASMVIRKPSRSPIRPQVYELAALNAGFAAIMMPACAAALASSSAPQNFTMNTAVLKMNAVDKMDIMLRA